MNNSRDIQLSPNFTLGEFMVTEENAALLWQEFLNHPKRADILQNLTKLAQRLQVLRDVLGKPVRINSGWRSKRVNEAVGGEDNSTHMLGLAADIEVEGVAPSKVQLMLKNWAGGMGCYKTFTHLDIRPTKARW